MNNSYKKCIYQYRIGRTRPKSCDEKALPNSEYCIWHDQRPKKDYSGLAPQLEKAVNEKFLSTEGFSLKRAHLRGLTLKRANLIRVDFEGADLTRSYLRGSDISHGIFRNANLCGADLIECRGINTNFQGARLDEANFSGAFLEDAKFEGSSYRGANFDKAYLGGTELAEIFGEREQTRDRILKRFMPNPFRPKAGDLPTWFGGREAAKRQLTLALARVTQGRPNHLVVLGDWGMGKTALLLWLKGEAQHQGIWASYMSVPLLPEEATLKDVMATLVEGISRGFSMGVLSLKRFLKTVKGFGFSVGGYGVSLSRKMDVQPMTLLSDTLLSLWDDLSGRSECVILIVDNADRLRPGRQVLSVLQETLTQLTVTTPANLAVVLSATPAEWIDLTGQSGYTPTSRYFSDPPVLLERLSDSDVIDVIHKTLEGTEVTFEPKVIKCVQEFARGHPFDLQIICKILYDAQLGGTVPIEAWAKSKAEAERWHKRVITKREQAVLGGS